MSFIVVNPSPPLEPKPVTPSDSLISLTFQPHPGETLPEFSRRFARELSGSPGTPLHLQAFGDCRAGETITAALQTCFGRVDWPVTWVAGAACDSQPVAGLQVHLFTGHVDRLQLGRQVMGSVFTDGDARQCLIGGLLPAPDLTRPQQTARAIEQLQALLVQAGFELTDVIRTWFFLDQILKWYPDFNRARNGIYSGLKFRTGSLPASTGVGAANPAGAALALAAWAHRPLAPSAYANEIASPLQCPAPAYGSAFSRAMETSTNQGRRLFLSGTASIAPAGETLWVGDVRQQVRLTMEVVEAILHSRNFTWADLTRATAYFRHPADVGVLADWLGTRQLSSLPVVRTQCDVCRDDLLFELEAEAETCCQPANSLVKSIPSLA